MNKIDFLFGFLVCFIPVFIIFLVWLWLKYVRWLSFSDFLWGLKSFTCFYCHKKTRRKRWYNNDSWNMSHHSSYRCPKCKEWNNDNIITNK